ncbi:unnamed protein product, partial [Mesorhabditis spiculigera]
MGLYDDDEELAAPTPTTSDEAAPPLKRTKLDDVDNLQEASNGIAYSAAAGDPSKFADKAKPASGSVSLVWSLCAKKGEREDMQDAHLVVERMLAGKNDVVRCAIFGIFDGHAGARAALHCEHHLAGLLEEKLKKAESLEIMEKALKRYFTEVYRQLDDQFLAEAKKNKPVWKDGTTATTALLLNNTIYVANIGDSRAIVARQKEDGSGAVAVPLTVDHNPTIHEERMRIQKTGASVIDGRVNGSLEVSRSIGDGHFKANGVISTPDMRKLALTDRDRFLLVACDGLWKVFSNEAAIEYVTEKLNKAKKVESVIAADSPENAAWDYVAEEMAAEAVRRKCGDNVSVIIVRLTRI